jgi:uncharacterized membrane protein
MSLAPLLAAPLVIQVHAFAAMAAFVLGLIQFAAPKGTIPHRTFGWIWVVLMGIVSVTAFFIHGYKLWGLFSPIHLLAIFAPCMMILGIRFARQHRVRGHRLTMIGLFLGAMVAAGGAAFLPGRLMHAVVMGQ